MRTPIEQVDRGCWTRWKMDDQEIPKMQTADNAHGKTPYSQSNAVFRNILKLFKEGYYPLYFTLSVELLTIFINQS